MYATGPRPSRFLRTIAQANSLVTSSPTQLASQPSTGPTAELNLLGNSNYLQALLLQQRQLSSTLSTLQWFVQNCLLYTSPPQTLRSNQKKTLRSYYNKHCG